jgi:hypothetical protein
MVIIANGIVVEIVVLVVNGIGVEIVILVVNRVIVIVIVANEVVDIVVVVANLNAAWLFLNEVFLLRMNDKLASKRKDDRTCCFV